MGLGDVVDQLHDQDGLADAGTAEQSDLTSLGVRGQQVDDLDAGDEDLLLHTHLHELGRFGVDGGSQVGRDRASLVDGLADDVDDASQGFGTDWDTDGRACVGHALSTDQTFGTVHGDGADGVFSQVLGDFQHQAGLAALHLQGVQDWRQVVVELDVNDSTNYSNNLNGKLEKRRVLREFCVTDLKTSIYLALSSSGGIGSCLSCIASGCKEKNEKLLVELFCRDFSRCYATTSEISQELKDFHITREKF